MRTSVALLAALASVLLVATAPAQAEFRFLPGSSGFDIEASQQNGSPAVQAGTHPHSFEIGLGFEKAGQFPDGDLREAQLRFPPGFQVNPTAVETCSAAQFSTPRSSPFEASLSGENCQEKSQIGTVEVRSSHSAGVRHFGLFNLMPPYGVPGAIGFAPFGIPIVLDFHVREADGGLNLELEGVPQSLGIDGLRLSFWSTPWAIERDGERGNCLNEVDPAAYHGKLSTPAGPGNQPPFQFGTCTLHEPMALDELAKAYPTLPAHPCGVPFEFTVSAVSWQGQRAEASDQIPPLEGCSTHFTIPKLQLTTDRAAVGTGLVLNLDVNDDGGLLNPKGIVRPSIREAVASLPQGLTINPSLGSGLGVCTEAEFSRESVDSAPGSGCPNASKVGELEVGGMLGIAEPLTGSLFVAKPYENPFGSLLGLYMVASNPRRGLFVKAAGKVEPDQRTGQLVATFVDLPRLPYAHFRLSFREGNRAVMISPHSCGDYPTGVALASWADPTAFSRDSRSFFRISRGSSGGACPGGGLPPFAPKLTSGSLNPVAGAHTDFLLHMTRSDADQQITSYSATFPPGLLAKIGGTSYCPDAAIEAAKHRSSALEEASPTCPRASYIGRTLAGYGIGSVLAYAPGALYLAGPYKGAPLSVVAITSARVGPFDLETVVIRSPIRIDPRTAQATIEATGEDPIPHMLKGIPLHLRDIRVYVDRPGFTLNPTSCDPLSVSSRLTGAGADPFSNGDDVSAVAPDRFQLLDCSSLDFRPRIALRLLGGTKRGDYPALRATVTPRPGNAGIAKAVVTLPPSEFLAQEHIETICSRPQAAAGKCPPGSIYGRARAITPLMDEPLEGPVYLRASDNKLPDLVAALSGRGVRIDVVGRIGSKNGGMRASYDVLPDAPVSKFVLSLRGGKRGLLVNSDNACKAPAATARMVGHNNKGVLLRPPLLNPKCDGKRARGKRGGKR